MQLCNPMKLVLKNAFVANNIYKWTDWYATHYLIELAGNAGKTIWGVNVGSKITVNGKTYTVQGRKGKINRVKDGTDFLVSVSTPGGITFQSCDPGPEDTVTIWWAK